MIALVITVILILLLAGISIAVFINSNIIKTAMLSSDKYMDSANAEANTLTELYSSILVATDDDAKITISMKDLDAVINEKVKNATQGATSVPIGNIISQMGTKPPVGYLICDGREYKISDYPLLASYFNEQFGSSQFFGGTDGNFKVPDLRGEFLRGYGTNSHANQGDGEDVGLHQDATEHTYITGSDRVSWISGSGTPRNSDKLLDNSYTLYGGSGAVSLASTYPRHYASRPTNTSVLYCIKY